MRLLDPEALPLAQRERRDRVVLAATQLLRDGEYDSVQMRDVAKEGGVALATVYRYFPSKEQLFGAVLLQWASGYPTAAHSSRRDRAFSENDIRSFMRRAVRAFEQFPQMVRVLMVVESSTDPATRALYHEFAGNNVGSIVRALPSVEPSVATAIIETAYGVMVTKLRAWLFGLVTIRQVERAVERCLDLIFAPPPLSSEPGA